MPPAYTIDASVGSTATTSELEGPPAGADQVPPPSMLRRIPPDNAAANTRKGGAGVVVTVFREADEYPRVSSSVHVEPPVVVRKTASWPPPAMNAVAGAAGRTAML